MFSFEKKAKSAQHLPFAKSAQKSQANVKRHRDNQLMNPIHRAFGNQTVLRLLHITTENIDSGSPSRSLKSEIDHDFCQLPVQSTSLGNVQPKLKITAFRDRYEQEADLLADQVMRSPDSEDGFPRGAPRHLKLDGTQYDDEQLRALDPWAQQKAGGITEFQSARSSSVRQLEPNTRRFMESRFGYDFSGVRIHTSSESFQFAAKIHADAYTIGRDIHFGRSKYRPNTVPGRKLIAHELAHTIQNGSVGRIHAPFAEAVPHKPLHISERLGAGRFVLPFRNPDVVHNDYQSFYVNEMFQRPGTQVRIQFYQEPTSPETATMALWYEETGSMERVTLPTNGAISPVILQEALGVVSIDIDGDRLPDVIIQAFPVRASGGLLFQVNANGQNVLAMHVRPRIAPPQLPPRVPTGARFVGMLPNGRRYYVLPYTSVHPAGPFYVDEEGNGVNPALEHRAAATMEGVEQGLLIGAAALLVLGTAGVALEMEAGAAVGSAILRFLFSPRSLVAGGTSAGANLISQAIEYGSDWDRYNWPSVGFDYVLGIVSYRLSARLFETWPAPIFSPAARNLSTWANFGRQQAVFALYGTAVGLLRAHVSNTSGGQTVAAQHVSGAVQMAKSGAMQSFLSSSFGRENFPQAMRDPRIIFLNRLLSLILNVAVREVFDIVPGQSERATEEE